MSAQGYPARPTAKFKKRINNTCFRGHELTDDNVYVYRGHKNCRACRSLISRTYAQARGPAHRFPWRA